MRVLSLGGELEGRYGGSWRGLRAAESLWTDANTPAKTPEPRRHARDTGGHSTDNPLKEHRIHGPLRGIGGISILVRRAVFLPRPALQCNWTLPRWLSGTVHPLPGLKIRCTIQGLTSDWGPAGDFRRLMVSAQQRPFTGSSSVFISPKIPTPCYEPCIKPERQQAALSSIYIQMQAQIFNPTRSPLAGPKEKKSVRKQLQGDAQPQTASEGLLLKILCLLAKRDLRS